MHQPNFVFGTYSIRHSAKYYYSIPPTQQPFKKKQGSPVSQWPIFEKNEVAPLFDGGSWTL